MKNPHWQWKYWIRPYWTFCCHGYIYITVQYVSIYSSGSNQDGVLDELKPQIISFLNKVLLNGPNLKFMDFQNPNEISDEDNKWTIGLYLNLTIESPICGPMVLCCIIHIHLKLYINKELDVIEWMDIWVIQITKI